VPFLELPEGSMHFSLKPEFNNEELDEEEIYEINNPEDEDDE